MLTWFWLWKLRVYSGGQLPTKRFLSGHGHPTYLISGSAECYKDGVALLFHYGSSGDHGKELADDPVLDPTTVIPTENYVLRRHEPHWKFWTPYYTTAASFTNTVCWRARVQNLQEFVMSLAPLRYMAQWPVSSPEHTPRGRLGTIVSLLWYTVLGPVATEVQHD